MHLGQPGSIKLPMVTQVPAQVAGHPESWELQPKSLGLLHHRGNNNQPGYGRSTCSQTSQYVSMASLPTCAEWGNGREYCADSRPAAKLDRLKMGDRCLGPMLGTMLEMLVAKQPPRTHRGNTQLLPTWRITTGCYWLFQLNQPYKLGISWFIHPYGWVATRCFNNLLVLIFSVYHCIHQFRSSGHPRSVTTRSSSRLGPQPQDVPTPLVLPSASEAPAQLTWSDVTWQNKHNIYIYT